MLALTSRQLTLCCLGSFAPFMCLQLRSMPAPMVDCIVLPADMCISLIYLLLSIRCLPFHHLCVILKCHISVRRARPSRWQLRIGRVPQAFAVIFSQQTWLAASFLRNR